MPEPTPPPNLRRALAHRLLGEQPAAIIAHSLLTVAVIGFLGPAPLPLLLGWATALAARAFGFGALRRIDAAPEAITRRIRGLVVASGLAWGVGAAALAPDVVPRWWALLLVVMAGLVASAPEEVTAVLAHLHHALGRPPAAGA
jgi:hypothetical protein